MKRILIKVFLWIAGIAAAIIIAAVIGINIVFKPSVIIGAAEDIASEYINGTLSIKDAEVSLFSTFPHLAFRLDSVAIGNADGETLASTDRIAVAVNIKKYLSDKRIVIENLTIEAPYVSYRTDTSGHNNWDGLIIATDTDGNDIDTSSNQIFNSLSSSNFGIRNAIILYDDANAGNFISIKDLDISLRGGGGKKGAGGRATINAGSITARSNGLFSIKDKPASIETRLGFKRDSMICRFSDTKIRLGGIGLEGKGSLVFENGGGISTDIDYGMDIRSLTELLEMIPPDIIPDAGSAKVKGSVSCSGNIKGRYDEGHFPVATGDFSINGGAIAYKGMPASIDELGIKFGYRIDLNKEEDSFVRLDTLTVKGGGIDISGKGWFVKLLEDPAFFSLVKANVDLKRLYDIFPFASDIDLKGYINMDLAAGFSAKNISEGDFGKIRAGGRFGIDSLRIIIPSDSMSVNIMRFYGRVGSNMKNNTSLQGLDRLRGNVSADSVLVISKNGFRLFTDTLAARFSTSPLRDTTMIATMEGLAEVGQCRIYLRDTLFLGAKSISVNAGIEPVPSHPRIPRVKTRIYADSVRARYIHNRFGLDKADIDLTLTRLGKKKEGRAVWIPAGNIDMAGFRMFTPSFPVRIAADRTTVIFDREGIKFDKVLFRIGHSDMQIKGAITNLWRGMFKRDTIKAELNVHSHFLNVNQLLWANYLAGKYRTDDSLRAQVAAAGDNIDSTSALVASDTTAMDAGTSLFTIPERLDVTFTSRIDNMRLARTYIEGFKGDVTIKNGAVKLDELSFTCNAIRHISGCALYKAKSRTEGYAGFELNMENMIVDSVITMMPALDSLVPMLRSLKGNVDVYLAAETGLDSMMRIKLPELRSGMHIEGRNLTLLDGETFSEIAKMLKFKNKERNVIDSVAVNLSVEDEMIEVFPFVLTMDRYVLAAGGTQRMDSSFDYHISLLESPILFKVGIDITGNLNGKMKYKITKAKYKDITKATRRSRIDSTALDIRFNIDNMRIR